MTTPLAQLQHMLEPFLALLEGGTEDIAVNAPHEAWVLRAGKWSPFEMPTLDHDTLVDMTILAASISDQHVSKRYPLLYTELPMPDRAPLRLMAILPPAVESGLISWTLRQPDERIHPMSSIKDRYATEGWNKLELEGPTRDHSIALGFFDNDDIEGFMSHMVRDRYNLLLCGSTGAGKTGMGITCINEIPDNERLLTIENAREYRLRQKNKVHLIYSQGEQSIAQVTQRDLQRASLRSRPDRVLVQELLDSQAAETWVSEVLSGHPGSVTTIHGETPAEAAKKLFGMVKGGMPGSSDATVKAILCSAIDAIVPFRNRAGRFSIGGAFFAPAAARRGKTLADLIDSII